MKDEKDWNSTDIGKETFLELSKLTFLLDGTYCSVRELNA